MCGQKAEEGYGLTHKGQKQKEKKAEFGVAAAPKEDGEAYLSLDRRRRGRWQFLVLKEFVDLYNAHILMFEDSI